MLVIGNGGLARELLSHFESIQVCNFFTDLSADYVEDTTELKYLVAVGHPTLKEKLVALAEKKGYKVGEPLIHSTAYVGRFNLIGKGVIVSPNCSITTNVKVGQNTFINLNCTIGHDTTIGSFCQINPGANISGNVSIGDKVLIGTGAAIKEGVKIGNSVVVGMGAVVLKDVPDNTTVVGNPAKPIMRIK